MGLAALSEMERSLFKSLTEALHVSERCDYEKHRLGASRFDLNAEGIASAQSMMRKGWFVSAPTYDEDAPLILSRDAWGLIALDEWEEISQSVRIQDSGDVFGSW